MEMERVPKAGYPIEGLWISGIQRKLTFQNLLFPLKLVSSLWKAEQILRAQGEAQAIIAVANAKAKALKTVGDVAKTPEGQSAVQLDLAAQAISAKESIAKESSVVLLSDEKTGAANLVAEAMTIINTLNAKQKTDTGEVQ